MLQQEPSWLYHRWDPQKFRNSQHEKAARLYPIHQRNAYIPHSSLLSTNNLRPQQTTLSPMSKLRLPPGSMLVVHPTKLHFWHFVIILADGNILQHFAKSRTYISSIMSIKYIRWTHWMIWIYTIRRWEPSFPKNQTCFNSSYSLHQTYRHLRTRGIPGVSCSAFRASPAPSCARARFTRLTASSRARARAATSSWRSKLWSAIACAKMLWE